MAGCKCRFCQASLLTQNACKAMVKKQTMYFCDEEHYSLYLKDLEIKEQEKQVMKELAAKRKKEQEEQLKKERTAHKEAMQKLKEKKLAEEKANSEKYKADKDKVYWLICEIVNRKNIINTVLWKEWKVWNEVASNEVIGQYLEENKNYLINVVSNIDNVEFLRIRYLSTIIKNNIGDYKPNTKETAKPKVAVDETFYTPTTNGVNKRRSLADLEDDL